MPRPQIEDGTIKRLNKWIEREKISDRSAGTKNSGITVDRALNLLLDKVGIEEDVEDYSLLSD